MIMGAQAILIPTQAAPVADRRRNQISLMSDDRGLGAASHHRDQPDTQREPGGNPHPNEQPRVGLVADLLIRALGLFGIGLSAGAGLWLYRLLHTVPPPGPSLGQYVLAAVTFLGASVGSGLLILGGHIHDRIEIAERYRRRW